MPKSFWRSADAVAQLNQLERAGFALEFLRRNPAYRDDYVRTQRRIARAPRENASDEASVTATIVPVGCQLRNAIGDGDD